jgi:hypothetical protein
LESWIGDSRAARGGGPTTNGDVDDLGRTVENEAATTNGLAAWIGTSRAARGGMPTTNSDVDDLGRTVQKEAATTNDLEAWIGDSRGARRREPCPVFGDEIGHTVEDGAAADDGAEREGCNSRGGARQGATNKNRRRRFGPTDQTAPLGEKELREDAAQEEAAGLHRHGATTGDP